MLGTIAASKYKQGYSNKNGIRLVIHCITSKILITKLPNKTDCKHINLNIYIC